jgi:hypothetical protein
MNKLFKKGDEIVDIDGDIGRVLSFNKREESYTIRWIRVDGENREFGADYTVADYTLKEIENWKMRKLTKLEKVLK